MADDADFQRAFQYDKRELRQIASVIRKMGDEAKDQAKAVTSSLVDFAVKEIKTAAGSHPRPKQARRIAEGIRISKSSVVGEFGLGFASQRFSGGATTQQIWGGAEFGSNRYKQFPVWSGREGRGSRGWFIYPTLRSVQPDIIKKWEESFSKIVKEYD